MAGSKKQAVLHPLTVILYIIVLWTLVSCVTAKRRRNPPVRQNKQHTLEEEKNGGKRQSRVDHVFKVDGENEDSFINNRPGNAAANDVIGEGGRTLFNSSKTETLTPEVYKSRMRAKHIRLFAIRQKILEKLGMTEQPNVTVPMNPKVLAIQKELKSLHWVEEDDEDEEKVIHRAGDDYLAKSGQVFPPSCHIPPKSDEGWKSKDRLRLYFDIEKEVKENDRVQFSTSTLWLYKKPLEDYDQQDEVPLKGKRSRSHKRKRKRPRLENDEDHKLKITIYRYVRPVKKDKKEKKELVSSQVVSKEHDGWLKLDMKAAVENWLNKPKKNFGVSVVTEDSEGNVLSPSQVFVTPNCSGENAFATLPVSLPILQQNLHGNSSQVTRYNSSLPALDIYTVATAGSSARLKRASHNKKQYSFKKPHCGTEEMYVKFQDLGWKDWIIQPQGFKHVTCKGSCSRFPRNKQFRRKVAQSEQINFKPIDHLCCGPIKFKPLKVIHLDANQGIKLSIFEDFLITECACLDGGN